MHIAWKGVESIVVNDPLGCGYSRELPEGGHNLRCFQGGKLHACGNGACITAVAPIHVRKCVAGAWLVHAGIHMHILAHLACSVRAKICLHKHPPDELPLACTPCLRYPFALTGTVLP